MKLGEHDTIITADAESANGPGWANQPIWVVVKSRLDGAIRVECIQPNEQSREMLTLYRISEEAHKAMTVWVEHHFRKKRATRREMKDAL